MNVKLLLVALAAALTTPFVAIAADPPAKDATASDPQTAKTEPAKKKVKPHSHVEAKGGPAPAEVAEAKAQPKRPPHDHLKDHKHM